MLDHAHFWPLVSEKCWSEGRWWPIRGSWWWIITNRRCRWHFTLFCDEEESPSTRWSNRLNKGALKATVSLEEPVDLPRSRRLAQEAAGSLKTVMKYRLSIEDLNLLRLHTVSVLHIASLWRWLSMSLTVHSALCSGTGGRGFGCRPEEIWDFFAILFFMCVFNFSSVEDHQPHTSCFILTAVTCQGRGCCSAGLFILITGATNPLHTRYRFFLNEEHSLYTCFKIQEAQDFQMKIILETQVMAHQRVRCYLPLPGTHRGFRYRQSFFLNLKIVPNLPSLPLWDISCPCDLIACSSAMSLL